MPSLRNITALQVSVDIIDPDPVVTPGAAAWLRRRQLRVAKKSIVIPGNGAIDFPWDLRTQPSVSALVPRVLVYLDDAGVPSKVMADGRILPLEEERNPMNVAAPPPPPPTPQVSEATLMSIVDTVHLIMAPPEEPPAPTPEEPAPPLPAPEVAASVVHPDADPQVADPPAQGDEIPALEDAPPVPVSEVPPPPSAPPDVVIPPLDVPVDVGQVDLPPLPEAEVEVASETLIASESFTCPNCGFVSMSRRGLNRHFASCKAK